MANKTVQSIQTKLKELALALPLLPETEQWAEVSRELKHLASTTTRRELLLETVAAISDAASSISEIDELLQVSVNLIRDYFDFYYIGIFLTDESNEWATLRAGTGELGQFLLEKKHHLKVASESLIGRCIASRQPYIANADQEEIPYPSALLPEIRSEIVLPLINRGQVMGALDILSTGATAFSPEDITLFQTLADQLANTIYTVNLVAENIRLLNQAENSQRFLKTVIEHIPDPIFIKNKDHILLEMNQANAHIIGQPEQDLIGKTDRDFFPPELANKFYERDNQVFTTNQILVAEDTTIWGDGQNHTAYTRLIPIPNAAGQPEYLLGITHDVTESRAHEAEREQLLAEMAALYQASRALAGALSERQIFEVLFEQMRRHDPCEISAFRFRLVDNEPTWADLRANWQKINNPSYPVGTRFFLPETSQARLLISQAPFFIDNIATDDRLSAAERESFAPTAACSVAILPLAATGQRLGAILVYFTKPYTFTQEIQRLWLAITDQVRVALVNHQLIEDAAYRTVRLETAAEIASAASSILDLQELLDTVVTLIRDRFNLYYVGAFLVDPPDAGRDGGGWAILKAGTAEEGRIQLQKKHRLKIGGESMIGWSISHRQPRIALDVGKEAVRFHNPDLPKTRSEMALPLIYHHEAIGALTIQSEEQAAFSREDIIFLQTMADQLANAVKNAQLYEHARERTAELEESRNFLNSIIQNIPSGIFVKEAPDLRFVQWNTANEALTGLRREEVIGKSDYDFFPKDEADFFTAKDREVLTSGKPLDIPEEPIHTDKNEIRLLHTRKIPILGTGGKPKYLLGISEDITERKQAEEAQRKMLARTQLLYNISEALATLINQQAAFETVLGEYLLLLNVSRGGIMLFDPANEYNKLEALYIDGKVVEPNLVFPVEEDLIAQYLRENPFPLMIEDVQTHSLTKHNQHIRGQVESMLLIPVVTRGEVIGILGADATEKEHRFTHDDMEIGEAIADQLAIWLENRELLAEAQYRSDLLQTAAEISRAASSILDVNELINTSVNLIRDQFDFYYVGLFLVDEAREWAVLHAGTGEAGRIQLERNHRLKIGEGSMIGWCIQNRQARIALDVGKEAVRFQNPVLPDTRSEMALPLISRDQAIGALTVQSTERGAFSSEDITVLQTMADQLANAIENARLFTQVTQAQKEAEGLLIETLALQKFSQKLAGTLRVKEILDIFFEACNKVMGFEYALFSLVDKYQDRVKAIAGFGVSEAHVKGANCSLDSSDIMADVVKSGKTEVITGWDDRLNPELLETESRVGWLRVFVPITLQQENIGLVEVGFNKNIKNDLTDSQIRLLRTFIDQTALALDNAQRYEASQRAARREALIKEITTKVRASTNLDTILQTTVKEIGDALGSQRTYVHLVSPTNGETHPSPNE